MVAADSPLPGQLLLENEEIRWYGRPRIVGLVSGVDGGIVALAAVWCVSILALMIIGLVTPLHSVAVWEGAALLIVGMMLLARLLRMRSGIMATTIFAITNTRVVVWQGGAQLAQAMSLDEVDHIDAQLRPDGTGSIIFVADSGPTSRRVIFKELANADTVRVHAADLRESRTPPEIPVP